MSSKTTTSEPYPGTQSVVRAISLLKAFSETHPEWGLTDLAQRVDLNKTTVYRLLTALESEGMVVQNPATQSYRLGPEMIALGTLALRSSDLRSASHPALEVLARETGETATLEILMDDQVFILDEVMGRHLIGATPSIGTRWPAHATSTGKVLLAHLPAGRRESILEGRLAQFTDDTVVSPEALEQELAQVRRQGYATVVGELEPDFVAVGAPVRNLDGDVVAALSVGGPRNRLTEERIPEIAGLVREAAERVSRRLGFHRR